MWGIDGKAKLTAQGEKWYYHRDRASQKLGCAHLWTDYKSKTDMVLCAKTECCRAIAPIGYILSYEMSLWTMLVLNHLGWSGGAKVSSILRHWGVQLILAYSWASR